MNAMASDFSAADLTDHIDAARQDIKDLAAVTAHDFQIHNENLIRLCTHTQADVDALAERMRLMTPPS